MRPLLALLAMIALPALAEDKSGAEVYESTCKECHGDGKLNAPRLGDSKRWGGLVREGLNELVPTALRGIRQMPAKGGNPALSDLEVARGVIFMANAGGGKFSEPTPADIARWRKKADASKKK
ncbi:c-type cytochrome [Dechloromonas hortensis]|uniref:c-type cytochrome n=1 Tax=Dechloromonas hortensis TaxID=337779 RepID=UPI0012908E59|nr:c-type cytochrome [Dechloromonas hortensis]